MAINFTVLSTLTNIMTNLNSNKLLLTTISENTSYKNNYY